MQQETWLAVHPGYGETGAMKGFGERLRLRARALGLTDSEVARRLDLSQGRYSNYVNEVVEPDLATLVRIVGVLGISADQALGIKPSSTDSLPAILRERIALAAETMEPAMLQAAAAMFDAATKALRPKNLSPSATEKTKAASDTKRI